MSFYKKNNEPQPLYFTAYFSMEGNQNHEHFCYFVVFVPLNVFCLSRRERLSFGTSTRYLAVVLSGQSSQTMGIYTEVFMQGLGGFAVKYFPLFILGAIFGKLMEDSGYACSVAPNS